MLMSRPLTEKRHHSTGSLSSVTANPPSPLPAINRGDYQDAWPMRTRHPATPRCLLDDDLVFAPQQIARLPNDCKVLTEDFRNCWATEYTAANLNTLDIHYPQGAEFALVHESHPIITLLAYNTHLLGAPIAQYPRTTLPDDPQGTRAWLTVSRDTVFACCDAILAVQPVLPRARFWSHHAATLHQPNPKPPRSTAPCVIS